MNSHPAPIDVLWDTMADLQACNESLAHMRYICQKNRLAIAYQNVARMMENNRHAMAKIRSIILRLERMQKARSITTANSHLKRARNTPGTATIR